MATDKLDIIISQQQEHGRQLSKLVETVGEHSAEIRNLRDGLCRVEKKVDKIALDKASGAYAGEAVGDLLDGVAGTAGAAIKSRGFAKVAIIVGTALASVIAAILAALGAQ